MSTFNLILASPTKTSEGCRRFLTFIASILIIIMLIFGGVSGCGLLKSSGGTYLVKVGTEDGVEMCVQKSNGQTSSSFPCPR